MLAQGMELSRTRAHARWPRLSARRKHFREQHVSIRVDIPHPLHIQLELFQVQPLAHTPTPDTTKDVHERVM